MSDDVASGLEKNFEYSKYEMKLYDLWMSYELFCPDVASNKEAFCIMMPPPNVTGVLHLGHALDCTLQDIIVRFKRMSGFNVLWLPGTDHASISTELKVVDKLRSDGISKEDIGRDKFIEYALAWKEEYAEKIAEQIRVLGCSCDWSRMRFTMDKGFSRAVIDVFVDLYNRGLIYRGERIINWCPCCSTVISDAEVSYIKRESYLYYIKYQIKDTNEFVEFATTRPETLFGDTAVAVHPDDVRYIDLVGKTVVVPFAGRNIHIIKDSYVDPDFGSGMVKITPAHDFNDYMISKRHNLEAVSVLNDDGSLNEIAGEFAGLNSIDAREKIVRALDDLGLFVKRELINNSVSVHERCGNVVEPMIKPQWFIKTAVLVPAARDAYKLGSLHFHPLRFGKIYLDWLDKLDDWCISRQLWWGHRIPAFYCKICGHITVTKNLNLKKCQKCSSDNIEQDKDVLDTWFSSGLWPFATLGWPDDTVDYKCFYPTDVLVTGYDIILFWVIRMMLLGVHCTDKIPFKDVVVHGLVRDAHGKKMSKSLGNGVDLRDVVKDYGADVLRLSLVCGSSLGNDIRFKRSKLEFNRLLLNKIWNAARFVLGNLKLVSDIEFILVSDVFKVSDLLAEDKWILSKLNLLVRDVSRNIESYDYGVTIDSLVDFFKNDFCDWYIEISKLRLRDRENSNSVLICLYHVLLTCLKLFHPFIPFITERIYQSLRSLIKDNDIVSIMQMSWPMYRSDVVDEFSSTVELFELSIECIRSIRVLRADMDIHPASKINLVVFVNADSNLYKCLQLEPLVLQLCGVSNLSVFDKSKLNSDNQYKGASVTVGDAVFFLKLDDSCCDDAVSHMSRLLKDKVRLMKEIERSEGILKNHDFCERAPQDIVSKERKKLLSYELSLKTILEQIELIDKSN
jgi:valyl-tRNA synthetase